MDNTGRYDVLLYEIRKEQANALGLAGKRLQAALDRYRNFVRASSKQSLSDEQTEEALLNEVVDAVYPLMLQREFMGLIHHNIDWLQSAFDLPPQVLAKLGFAAAAGR